MTEPIVQRLPSAHLEDMAFIILTAGANGQAFDLYPDIDDDTRQRLRSRIKQLSRYDWPSSLREDPAFRRGYTLRQCCRLMVALLLLDAHLPPSLVVAIAQNNELNVLRSIGKRLEQPARLQSSPDDLVAIVFPAEIQDALGFPARDNREAERVEILSRHELMRMWSDDLPVAGGRLVIDVATATAAMWRWIGGRRLLSDLARTELLAEIEERSAEAGYRHVAERRLRR